MSDFVKCQFSFIDDVELLNRGINMMKELFSSTKNYGRFEPLLNNMVYAEDCDQRTVDVIEGDRRYTVPTVKQATIMVSVGDVKIDPVPLIGQNANVLHNSAGSPIDLTWVEQSTLKFTVVARQSSEARILARVILDYLNAFQHVLSFVSGGQVEEFVPLGKSEPQKLMTEKNAENYFASEVQVQIKYSSSARFAVLTPILADVSVCLIREEPTNAQLGIKE